MVSSKTLYFNASKSVPFEIEVENIKPLITRLISRRQNKLTRRISHPNNSNIVNFNNLLLIRQTVNSSSSSGSPNSTKVKCLSDAGMFLDAVDVSGGHSIRNMFQGVVTVQNLQKDLSSTCTNHLDPTSCFFPQNLVSDIKTPMFLLNTAYDSWQIQESLAPPTADPGGIWKACKADHSHCNSSQIQFFQEFRDQMVFAVNSFSTSDQNGLFINSCFAHCQSERQDTWFAQDSPQLNGKSVAESVGDWYFERSNTVKSIDCPYPCDTTCHNLIFDADPTAVPTANPTADPTALEISASSRFCVPLFGASLVPLVLTKVILRFLD